MSQPHPDPQLLSQLLHDLRKELNPVERRRLVRHLLSGCPACLAAVRPLWGCRPFAGRPRIHPASYRQAFDRVLEVGREREIALAEERLAAPQLCLELLDYAAGQRLAVARSHRRFHTVAVCELLLARSEQEGEESPAASIELAELAIALGERLDPRRCGRAVIQALRSAAWSCLGEARRRTGDLAGAERCLHLAEELLPETPTDPLERPELCRRQAALALDQGRQPLAEALLERACAGYRTAGDESRLAAALYAMAELHLELGRGEEALLQVQRLRPLYAQLNGERDLPRLCWLEGKIERSLDHTERAEWAFQEARAGFTAAGAGREAALVSFDLAILYAQQNRWQEIRDIAALLFSLLGMRDVRREVMAAFLVFQRTVEREGASLDFLVEVAAYLVDARRDRGRQLAA